MNDVNRLGILQDVIDRCLTTRPAASRLGTFTYAWAMIDAYKK